MNPQNGERALFLAIILGVLQPAMADDSPGDQRLQNYFRAQTAALQSNCLAEIKTLEDWKTRRPLYREQLFEMLGLSPRPERTDLKAVITGKIDRPLFTVEKLQFQPMPGLYITADLFLPKNLSKPAPTILYVCGHSLVASNGVSYGAKTGYEHHGSWFARNGYVCLILDTIELGEIRGTHHGTYGQKMWWWNSRGYTPAGVEAWNAIRALDYLETRREVDRDKFGITGRSGGGAYSWWVTALDDRIKVAAPVAGITDLQNHVVDGTVEGHCDCMFMVNTYRWDYPLVAALAAPRPLLIGNSDKDSIFPLDGVARLHKKVALIYGLYGATNNLALLITPGPHKDTQDLQIPVFRWFNQHLKGSDPVIEMAATHLFTPRELKVFDTLPADERTTTIHETFVPAAKPWTLPESAETWKARRAQSLSLLREKIFRGWPDGESPTRIHALGEVSTESEQYKTWEFESDPETPLVLRTIHSSKKPPKRIVLHVLDQRGWADLEAVKSRAKRDEEELHAYFAPRGIGASAWMSDERKQTQIRRRFMLLGQTLDAMHVFDIARAVQALREIPAWQHAVLKGTSGGEMGVNLVYAVLFSPIDEIEVFNLPKTQMDGPDYLNVLRFLDIPEAVALALTGTKVELHSKSEDGWEFPLNIDKAVYKAERFKLRTE